MLFFTPVPWPEQGLHVASYESLMYEYLHILLNFFITSGISTGFPDVVNSSTKLDICWHIVSSRSSLVEVLDDAIAIWNDLYPLLQ